MSPRSRRPSLLPARRPCRPRWALALLVLLAGCTERSGPIVDAGGLAATASPDAAAAEPVPPVSFSLVAQLPDAGLQAIPADVDTPPLVEPAQQLELRADLGLRNYRVRLFDEVDRAMVSDDLAEESDAGVVYRVGLPSPLKPGHAYSLVVDAQTGSTLEDALGRPVPDQRFEFRIAGEKEKPAPARPSRSSKRRRRN
jgi:hypothetical protein